MLSILTLLALVGAPSTALGGRSFAAFEGVYAGTLHSVDATALRPEQVPSAQISDSEADKQFSVAVSVRRFHGTWIAYHQGHVLCMLQSGHATRDKMVGRAMHNGPLPLIASCMYQGAHGVEEILFDTSAAETEARAERFISVGSAPSGKRGQRVTYNGVVQHRPFTWAEKLQKLFEG